MTKISATIVADSKNPQGDRITTMMITFPRFILAELNTHRMLSKNSASSRAIPFNKMVEAVQNNPFIPIAWQKEHKGMQGSEYITDKNKITEIEIDWINASINSINQAKLLSENEVTKQLCNRLLEPFMWHTVLCTATEFSNFFELRCPSYELKAGTTISNSKDLYFKSYKDLLSYIRNNSNNKSLLEEFENKSTIERLQINKGQAEIHMMALAEAMWDAMNESTPKELKAGKWHIPFEDKFKDSLWNFIEDTNLEAKKYYEYATKISTAMAAHTSYTTVGNEPVKSYEKWIELHDRLIAYDPPHSSPMEHCAMAMSEIEYTAAHSTGLSRKGLNGIDAYGWCRNFKGFIPYRELLENKK